MALIGIPRQAINSSGGVSKFFIADFAEVKTTIVEGVASFKTAAGEAITAENMPFVPFYVTKRSSNITSTWTGTPATGQGIEQQVATMIFAKQETSKRTELNAMKHQELVVIGLDFNGDWQVLGSQQGGDLVTNVTTTGTAGADLNGYTATVTADENVDMPTVDPAFITLLEAI